MLSNLNVGRLLIVLCISAMPLAGQATLEWEGDTEKAFEKAKKAGKPVLVMMHDRIEIACIRMLKTVYSDADVQRRLADFVVIPCAPLRDREVKGFKFGDLGDETLAKNERAIRERFFASNTVKVPQHIVMDPEGKVIARKIFQLSKTKLLDFLSQAMAIHTGVQADGLDSALAEHFRTIRRGIEKDRVTAVKAVAEHDDQKVLDILFHTIDSLKAESDRAVCIRALGYDDFPHAGQILKRWLHDSSNHIVNCAVVSIEETKADGMVAELLDVFRREKDEEIRKDVLRALGPCGGGDEKARDLLLKHIGSRKEKMRLAAYMSIGQSLSQEDVKKKIVKRYKKEGKNVTAKTAILYGFKISGDASLVADVKQLTKREKNKQLLLVVQWAIESLEGVRPTAGRAVYRALRPLFARDKIVRNRVKDWGGGGRGGKGRGGR